MLSIVPSKDIETIAFEVEGRASKADIEKLDHVIRDKVSEKGHFNMYAITKWKIQLCSMQQTVQKSTGKAGAKRASSRSSAKRTGLRQRRAGKALQTAWRHAISSSTK